MVVYRNGNRYSVDLYYTNWYDIIEFLEYQEFLNGCMNFVNSIQANKE